MHHPTRRHSFLSGLKDVSPVLLGVGPFGLIAGVVAMAAGIPQGGSMLMSVIVFAGASQLAAIKLLAAHAPLAVVIGTGMIINLRMVMYSASLGPHLTHLSTGRKALLSYFLTDQAYALSVTRFNATDKGSGVDRMWYYLGVALTVWFTFVGCTCVGALLGARVPASWSLDFAIPLTFISLTVPAIRDRAALVAALCAAGAAGGAATLPYNLGLMIGAFAGMAAGYAMEEAVRRGR
ncbi:MAG: AzlC family ABC transporter permease [Desulfovibrionaceae bacterium]